MTRSFKTIGGKGKRSRVLTACFLFVAALIAGSPTFVSAQTATITDAEWSLGRGAEFCGTQQIFEEKMRKLNRDVDACIDEGPCDIAFVRNSYIPDGSLPIRYIRLYFHIFREDNGTNPACTEQQLINQVNELNTDYLPAGFQFEYQYRFINSSLYRSCSVNEFGAMKLAYNADPNVYLNVWVSFIENGNSYGTFPWDSDAKTVLGGIMMNIIHMSTTQSALGHEVGHCLGLWHTQHGVSEVGQCSACYEPAGTTQGDLLGDRCQDTDPTPTNFGNCAPPGGIDPCSGLPWGPTDTANIMGYCGEPCWSEFSPQQQGRMQCWFDAVLSSWEGGVKIAATNTLGPAPLTVNFQGQTGKLVNSWLWDFGDGGTSNQQNPVHTYDDPGHHDVQLSIQTTDGSYETWANGLIWAYADTIGGKDTIVELNRPLRVDVSIRNFLPLNEVIIPFTWAGGFNLLFDSARTTGLRSDYIATRRLLTQNNTTKTAVYQLLINPLAQGPLAPGSGPVVSLWFRVPASIGGQQVQITFPQVNSYVPKLKVDVGDYAPALDPIVLSKCLPGDVDGDGLGPDGSDLQWMVDYLFFNGTPPPYLPSANADGLGGVDGSDLQFLVDHIFFNGPAPSVCR